MNPDVSSGLETVAPRRPTAEVRTIPTLPGVSTIPVFNPDVAGSPGLETITDSTNSTPAVPAADAASPAATPYEEVNVSPEILKDATTPAAAPASAPVMSGGGRVETVPVRRPSRDVGRPADFRAGRRPSGEVPVEARANDGFVDTERRSSGRLSDNPFMKRDSEAGGRVETAPVRRRDGETPARRPSNDAKPPTPSTPAAVEARANDGGVESPRRASVSDNPFVKRDSARRLSGGEEIRQRVVHGVR